MFQDIPLNRITAGALRHKIEFIEEKIKINDKGFKETTLETSFILRCKAENLNTREMYRLGQVNLETNIKFIVRNVKDKINSKHKIKFKDNLYTVTYIEDIFTNPNFIIIYASEIKGK